MAVQTSLNAGILELWHRRKRKMIRRLDEKMNVEAFLNQVVVVTLYDGNSHQGILRKVGTNPETDEEYVEVKEETGTNFVPVNEIMRIDSAVLH